MRRRRREATEADDQADVEPAGKFEHGVAERMPLVVRFGPHQQQRVTGERRRRQRQQSRRRPREPGVHPVLEVHHRPAGAVVEEPIVVERRYHRRRAAAGERVQRRRRRAARVDPTFHGHDEDRTVQREVGRLRRQLVDRHRSGHRVEGLIGAFGEVRDLVVHALHDGSVTAHDAGDVARVHALQDARQLPVPERDIEVEMLDVAP